MLEFFPFDSFMSLFTLVFVTVLVIIFLSAIISFIRLLRKPAEISPKEGVPMVREKEIVREIVKIRCPYCNNLYEEKYDKCPHCGGKRTP